MRDGSYFSWREKERINEILKARMERGLEFGLIDEEGNFHELDWLTEELVAAACLFAIGEFVYTEGNANVEHGEEF